MNNVAQITLAKLIEKIKEDTELAPTRQRDLISDLKSLARLLDRRLEAVPADLKALKSRINDFHHAQIGVSQKRLQNLRSSVTFVFQRYEITWPGTAPLTPVWQALFDQLQTKREQDGIVALFRYCASHQIAPQDITDTVTAKWCTWMQTQTLRKKPKQVYRQACIIWNEIGDRGIQAPGGIDLPCLAVPSHRAPSFTQPWSTFPRAFVEDIEAYGIWRSGKDLFSHEAPAKPSKPSSIALEKGHIRVLASAAIQRGYPLHGLNALVDLVSQDCVRAALSYYQTKLEGEYTTYLRSLTSTLLRIARLWVRDVEQASWIQERLRRMGSNPGGLTPKNRDTLRRFDDSRNIGLLLGLPIRLMERAEQTRLSPYRKAVQAQLALAIELLTVAPMRLANLTLLRLDSNLSWSGSGKHREACVSLHEQTVKNGVAQEYPLPVSSSAMLETYLREYRPQLVTEDNTWLFPGEGGHKNSHTLGQQLKAIIFKETGLKITPHQFRHLAAKLYLEQQPGNYETVRRLLGHRSIKTTVNFYTGLETHAAVAHYDETVERLRAAHVPTRRKRRS
jgi:integrase